ncbi:Conserved_hypothetical protein [Hexamita inflata]|uniref:Uncharacterized protein n=1 Tax=Hexamita inflata TaxID=28002 RepID=A0AA86TLY1_9EUKA|nr:Conserved hypothetical protein [Hexamita inflata]
MTTYLFQLREFYDDIYKNDVKFSDSNVLNFVYQNLKISNVIHNDIRRGLWRFRPLFENSGTEEDVMTTCRALQCVFEKFTFIVWSNMSVEIQKSYYQSVTDMLEIIYGSYVNFNQVCRDLSKFLYFNEDLKLFNEDISIYFNLDYNRAVSVGMQAILHLYSQTQFSQQSFMKMSSSVHKLVSRLAPAIIKSIPKEFSNDMVILNYMQYVTCFCLHFTTDLKLSTILTELYLTLNMDGQIYFIAQIINFCAQNLISEIDDGYEFLNQCVHRTLKSKNEDLAAFLEDLWKNANKKMFVKI